MVPAGTGMSYCHCRNPHQGFLDYLPQVVFFPFIHCNGMDMCAGFYQNHPGSPRVDLDGSLQAASSTPSAASLCSKAPLFNSRHKYFGSHEIFTYSLWAAACVHYIMMYEFVA